MSDKPTKKDMGKDWYDGEGRCYVVVERKGKLMWKRNPQGDSEARKHSPESYLEEEAE
jgi:hypothetical protein